ncbi:type I-B CRISPR-associated protein Cas8b1/Cst1 [Pyrococcus yayanosii]|uniref:CRISPR-associated CXXC_CXXC protein Cst1 n=1 Tax=Pyrococcus yayanosii (strain CH1 / JCM 16557) TaxID=529709 RepID=F8AEC5_PYRYC|nr:type I-B CRISPR-associated protein Cas8b1/Cst1 [Pyrococcus yayanosii]AEH24640.1 CRISPR-associated CXXC_CXXC protein Cst1 [Pyrococcus yayanosii CH1]
MWIIGKRFPDPSLHESSKEDNEKVSLFDWTGHPFVDAGLVALLILNKKRSPEELTEEDIRKATEFASKLYARKEWGSGYIHAMMLPNSGILMANPSMSKKRTPEAIAQNLRDLLQEPEDPNAPICEICGRRHSRPKPVYRSDFPLVGTGGVPNYFPSAKDGLNVCSHCLFLVQFLPLVAYKVGGRVLVMHTYPYELMLELHEEAINDVRKSFLASNARDFKRPENFLFRLLGELTRKTERDDLWGKASITLYHFVNNNQGQDLQIIHVPTPVLRFIAHASREDPKGWKRIVAMGWRKRPSEEDFEKYERSYANEVYSRLLAEESILPYFIDMKNRRANAKWSLLSFYCSEVLGLDKEALEFIKDVGDRIVETLEKLPDNQLSRRVRELERAEKLYQFEAFFVNLEKLRQRLGIEKPLMTFDEFATVLTSYGEDLNVSWRTVKHLLLFRIYERLHDKLMKASEEEEEVEENEEVGIFGMGVEG